MRHSHKLAIPLLLAAFAACTPKGKESTPTESSADSTQLAPQPTEAEAPDTLFGWVGDGTSMHNLEFLPIEGDTMEFELSDDVDRRAELVVGRKIAIAIRWTSNNEPQVIATLDPDEVGLNLPYED